MSAQCGRPAMKLLKLQNSVINHKTKRCCNHLIKMILVFIVKSSSHRKEKRFYIQIRLATLKVY